jgi:hypothetical protein
MPLGPSEVLGCSKDYFAFSGCKARDAVCKTQDWRVKNAGGLMPPLDRKLLGTPAPELSPESHLKRRNFA